MTCRNSSARWRGQAEDAERAARRGAVTRLGLACFTATREGEADVEIRWTLQRLLDRAPASEEAMLDTLVGRRQAATLGLDAFAHVEPIDFLVRLLRGALGEGAAGVNILIYGPPGTGKTELARTLAAAAGAVLHGVGEADEDGEEPRRWERVAALALAQRLLGGRGPAVLLFDEMEDLIGDASPSAGGDWFSRREGSKVFVNRLLEANPLPVIWTTNAIGNVDAAILRRMSFVCSKAIERSCDAPRPNVMRSQKPEKYNAGQVGSSHKSTVAGAKGYVTLVPPHGHNAREGKGAERNEITEENQCLAAW